MKKLSFQLLFVFKRLPWKLEKCVNFMIWKQTSKFFRSFSKTKRSKKISQKYETKLNETFDFHDFTPRWFRRYLLTIKGVIDQRISQLDTLIFSPLKSDHSLRRIQHLKVHGRPLEWVCAECIPNGAPRVEVTHGPIPIDEDVVIRFFLAHNFVFSRL